MMKTPAFLKNIFSARFSYVFILLLLMQACATNPATNRMELMLVSENKEFDIGKGVDKQVREEMGVYLEKPELRNLIKEIAENIGEKSHRPDLIYRAEIVDTPDFNAFAVPGGFVYVHRGLLERMNSTDELASVMGHEIAHVAARHSASQISKMQLSKIGLLIATVATGGELQNYGDLINIGSVLAFSKFSRDDEREADHFGIRYMTDAGYHPGASISVMKTIQGLHEEEPGALEVRSCMTRYWILGNWLVLRTKVKDKRKKVLKRGG
ncbi:M48 family metalloprotease [Thermodesulfobacteriota bacterium]